MSNVTTIPQFSEEGRRLADVMRETAIDAVIPYKALSAIIQKDVQRQGRTAMDCARRQLQREVGMVFAPVKNVGLKRLSDSGIVGTSHCTMRHINRSARRGAKRLSCVQDFTKLSKEDMVRHNTAMSMLGVFYEITKVKSVRQIEAVVAVTQRVLPLADTLNAFRV